MKSCTLLPLYFPSFTKLSLWGSRIWSTYSLIEEALWKMLSVMREHCARFHFACFFLVRMISFFGMKSFLELFHWNRLWIRVFSSRSQPFGWGFIFTVRIRQMPTYLKQWIANSSYDAINPFQYTCYSNMLLGFNYIYVVTGRPYITKGSGERPPDGRPQRYEAASQVSMERP